MDNAEMIRLSLRAVKFGWLALIPLLGVVFAFYVVRLFCRVFLFTEGDWNPATPQLYSGTALALFSLLIHALLLSTALWSLIQ